MMKKNVRRLLSASAGLVVGGFTTYMVVNAAAEDKRNEDVLTLHRNNLFYLIDAFGGVACAGLSYVLSSFCKDGYRALDEHDDDYDHKKDPFINPTVPYRGGADVDDRHPANFGFNH